MNYVLVTVPGQHTDQRGVNLFCSGRSILFIDQAEGNTLQAPAPPVPSIKEPEQVFSMGYHSQTGSSGAFWNGYHLFLQTSGCAGALQDEHQLFLQTDGSTSIRDCAILSIERLLLI
ncbi:MAG: hypothetical protein EA359_01625 [Balneolaceae bacterium]|nr:MAG: hypothetical protein EA359_01625 [Balneolaceae bacterium]